MFEYKTYTGIGSRETPEDIKAAMTIVAFELSKQGWILRSGAAPGADTAFEMGAKAALKFSEGCVKPEIYLPWADFEGRERGWVTRTEPQVEAYAIAAYHHPNWGRLTQGAKKLHARNVHQILGYDVERPQPSSFVICWTSDGKGKGGTGQALRIAKSRNIEIYDLYNEKDLTTMRDLFA